MLLRLNNRLCLRVPEHAWPLTYSRDTLVEDWGSSSAGFIAKLERLKGFVNFTIVYVFGAKPEMSQG